MVFVDTPASLGMKSAAPVQLISAEGLRIGINADASPEADARDQGAGAAAAARHVRHNQGFFVFVEPPLLSGTDRGFFDHLRLTGLAVVAVDTALVAYLASTGLDGEPYAGAARHTQTLASVALATNAVGCLGFAGSSSVGLWLYATGIALQTFAFLEHVLSSSQVLHHALHLVGFVLALSARQWTAYTFFQIASPTNLARAHVGT